MDSSLDNEEETSGSEVPLGRDDERPSSSSGYNTDDNSESCHFQLRGYQVDLIEVAKRENVALCLPTGSGKTFIALQVTQHMLGKYYGLDMKVVFLANTVPLVNQQAGFFEKHLPGVRVQKLVGDMGVDFFSPDEWKTVMTKSDVLVMSTTLAANAMDHGYLKWPQISLLILDECHHATKDHDMTKVMKAYTAARDKGLPVPRILGLTATIVKGKAKQSSLNTALEVIENNLCCRAVTHPNFEEVFKYSTSARVSLVRLDKPYFTKQDSSLSRIHQVIEALRVLPDTASVKWGKVNHHSLRNPSQIYNPPTSMRAKAKKIAASFIEVYEELGPYCATLATKYHRIQLLKYIKELEHVKNFSNNESTLLMLALETLNTAFLEYENTTLHLMKKQYQSEYLGNVRNDAIVLTQEQFNVTHFQSEKVKAVLSILDGKRSRYENSEGNAEALCGLIFCKTRLATKVLCWYLQALSSSCVEYEYLKVNFLVGSNSSNLDLAESRKASEWQDIVLTEFRLKKINVIVCTSVLEEGLDVPSCNLVIRFNGIDNYPSYIQSMGRARQKGASFFVLTPVKDYETLRRTVGGFQTLNETLSQTLAAKLLNHAEGEQYTGPQESTIPDFCPGGKPDSPRVTETEVISLVSRYCRLLGSDSIVPIDVAWCDKVGDQCIGYLKLPSASPVRGVIKGEPQQNQRIAKRSVYRRACELLYEAGELDENLMPRKKKAEEFENQFLQALAEEKKQRKSHQGAKKPDAKKITEKYERMVILDSLVEKVLPEKPLYLIRVHLKPEINTELDFSQHPYSFGFLSRYDFKNIPVFSLEVPSGLIKVSLDVCCTDLRLREDQLHKVNKFQEFMCRYIHLKPHISLLELKENDVLLVVVLKTCLSLGSASIDWERMQQLAEFEAKSYQKKPFDHETFKFYPAKYKDAVIVPWYRDDLKEGEELYYVSEVEALLTGQSMFPSGNGKTYAEHFATLRPPQTPVNLLHPGLPLLSCRKVSKRRNFLVQPLKRVKPRKFCERYPPELVHLTPIPACLLIQGIYLKAVIHRLDGLLLALTWQIEVGKLYNWNVSRDGKDRECKKSLSDVKSCHNEIGYLNDIPETPNVKSRAKSFGVEYENPINCNWNDLNETVSNRVQLVIKHGRNYHSTLNSRQKVVPCAFPSGSKSEAFHGRSLDTSFDSRTNFDIEKGPNLFDIMAAFTMANCNDYYNLEIFEIMGDAVLKIIVSCHIFSHCPSWKEGKMTAVRTLFISNSHLCSVGSRRKFGEILAGRMFSETEWIPPGFKVNSTSAQNFTHCTVNDKNIADCVEALIGAYYSNGGMDAALRVMSWIGLKGPGGPNMGDMAVPYSRHNSFCGLKTIRNFVSGNKAPCNIFPQLRKLEGLLGYKFKVPWLAVEAVTHASYLQNDVTSNYQRLEFIGDAVLDYLVTDYIVKQAKIDDPGKVTDIRSALVNNVTFGCIAERYGFCHFLLHSSEKLHNTIRNFSDFQSQHGRQSINPYLLLSTTEESMAQNVEVPKACGDVFEAIVGAVFQDSEFSFDTTWRVVYQLMKSEIDAFTRNPPINPIRMLMEKTAKSNQIVKINDIEYDSDLVKCVEIRVDNLSVRGMGSTKKHAKEAAAKSMLTKLNSLGRRSEIEE